MQLSSPPRTHQYKTRPANSSFRQPGPRQHDRSANGSKASLAYSQRSQYASRQNSVTQPQRSYQPVARHLSHISALTVSEADTGSRPISETFIVSPALPSQAVSEMGEEEEYNPRSAPHSRGGSQGRRTKTTTPMRSRKNSAPIRDSETLPSADQAATMNALTAAIRQGLHTTAAPSQPATPKPLSEVPGLRMPFQGEPESPSSVYTDVTATNKRLSIPLSSYQGYDGHNSRPLDIIPQEANDDEDLQYNRDIPTPMSSHPIMAKEHAGANPKVAAKGQSLRLDIGAVREAEARGSMTSLTDLIRRATRVASNLDRGKTASRLGHLDMFGSTDKLANLRNSTYSDVLDAFPPPAHGTGTNTPGRPTTMWPHGEKQYMASKSSLGRFVETTADQEKPRKRQCCGLSPIAFVIVLIIVFLLVAAAVLVPVFLLLVIPGEHKSVNLANCHATHTCQNGGYSVTADNICSCICVNGFTGADCSQERDTECVSQTLSDGQNTYKDATIGLGLQDTIQTAQPEFGIPLNATILLSQFAYNNLTCASENSLVVFNTQASARTKRFVIVPGMMSTEPHIPVLNLPPSESKQTPRFVIVDGQDDVNEEIPLAPTHTIKARQDATQSANGIVYATTGGTTSSTATRSGSTSTATSATNTPSSAGGHNVTSEQTSFAAVVVLYVLQTSSQINNAVTAYQAISAFFQESNPLNQTVEVIGGKDSAQANFETFQIEFSNGTIIGKSSSR